MPKFYLKAGENIIKRNSNWNFKGNVYKNFHTHINRYVTLYL